MELKYLGFGDTQHPVPSYNILDCKLVVNASKWEGKGGGITKAQEFDRFNCQSNKFNLQNYPLKSLGILNRMHHRRRRKNNIYQSRHQIWFKTDRCGRTMRKLDQINSHSNARYSSGLSHKVQFQWQEMMNFSRNYYIWKTPINIAITAWIVIPIETYPKLQKFLRMILVRNNLPKPMDSHIIYHGQWITNKSVHMKLVKQHIPEGVSETAVGLLKYFS